MLCTPHMFVKLMYLLFNYRTAKHDFTDHKSNKRANRIICIWDTGCPPTKDLHHNDCLFSTTITYIHVPYMTTLRSHDENWDVAEGRPWDAADRTAMWWKALKTWISFLKKAWEGIKNSSMFSLACHRQQRSSENASVCVSVVLQEAVQSCFVEFHSAPSDLQQRQSLLQQHMNL